MTLLPLHQIDRLFSIYPLLSSLTLTRPAALSLTLSLVGDTTLESEMFSVAWKWQRAAFTFDL